MKKSVIAFFFLALICKEGWSQALSSYSITDDSSFSSICSINKYKLDNSLSKRFLTKLNELKVLALKSSQNNLFCHGIWNGSYKFPNGMQQNCDDGKLECAEFIRIYGNYSMEEAQKIINKIAIPNYPVLFDIEDEEFIARDDLTVKQEILVLICKQKRNFNFLFSKTKDKNKSRFNKTLISMEKDKFIAFKDDFYHLLPKGIREIETKGLLNQI